MGHARVGAGAPAADRRRGGRTHHRDPGPPRKHLFDDFARISDTAGSTPTPSTSQRPSWPVRWWPPSASDCSASLPRRDPQWQACVDDERDRRPRDATAVKEQPNWESIARFVAVCASSPTGRHVALVALKVRQVRPSGPGSGDGRLVDRPDRCGQRGVELGVALIDPQPLGERPAEAGDHPVVLGQQPVRLVAAVPARQRHHA